MANLVGIEITTQLTIYSRDSDGNREEIAADSTPVVEVEKDGVDWLESADITVTNDSTGVYSFSWTPDEAAEYEVIWGWEIEETEYDQTEGYTVEGDIIGVSEQESDSQEDTEEPDLGTSKTCLVTGTFFDAKGDYMQGVYVRFTPLRLEDAFLTSGIVAHEVTASSGEDGAVSLYLVRGMKGTLTITGIGLVREVEVPDSGAIDIIALAATGDDLLEVQKPQFVKLPRRS